MKKIFLTLLLVAFATTTWAEAPAKKPSCSGFVTNGFWDNWEVSGAVGINTAFSRGANLGPVNNRFGFEGNFSIVKWVHPILGLRAQLQGGYFNNYDSQMGRMTWPYLFAHGDLMINFSNWVGGYRSDRAYYAVPFVGFGYMASNFTDRAHQDNLSSTRNAFAASFGLLNKFRLSPVVDFEIELKGLLARSGISPVRMSHSQMLGFSATVGFAYRFNNRDWKRASEGYSADDIRALQAAVAAGNAALEAANAENARLNERFAAPCVVEKVEVAAPVEAKPQVAAPCTPALVVPSPVIFYEFNEAAITDKERIRLNLLADRIKADPSDCIYAIEGYADQLTGTAAYNKRLGEERAKGVYNYLIKRGVDSKRLTWEGKGNVANRIEGDQKANCAVIIK